MLKSRSFIAINFSFLLLVFANTLASCFYIDSSLNFVFKAFFYALSWCLVYYCVLSFCNHLLRKFLEPLILILWLGFSMLAIVGKLIFDMPLDQELIDIILSSNLNESKEFILHSKGILFIIILAITLGIFLIYKINWQIKIPRKIALFLSAIILFIEIPHAIKAYHQESYSLRGTARYVALFKGVIFTKRSLDTSRNALQSYAQIRQISSSIVHISQKDFVPNVVLVIGESASKNFMQAYGYPLLNMPFTNALAQNNGGGG
ncbi:sulfatase-like hydrolase/transferase [Helicobacter cetorum]|uniref:Sulfatase N-terminal domain-containing protein n=1 Tax=Helicobacter cetorum (strain ATCC BAA-429 / MIT 00-7128) TaxID=182217 RepID=I0EN48_HELC0|nr:sulfatase-like hydrolase/transferase [Helicobacter cetorum]AFI04367.1 hypothetical protein HCW_05525 [Helicobacter cetorum MIT 00-7128]